MFRNRFVFSIDLKMAAMRRRCKNGTDVFCYICGEYMIKDQRLNIRDFTKQAYQAYFGIKLGDQDKNWAPHQACKSCTESLKNWTLGKLQSLAWSFGSLHTIGISNLIAFNLPKVQFLWLSVQVLHA